MEIQNLSVKDVRPSIIPSILDVITSNSELELLFEISEKFGLFYNKGEKVEAVFSKEKVTPKGGDSYCGKAFLFSIKDKEGKKVYLFSVGGLIIRISSQKILEGFTVAEEYYFCINKS